MEKIKAGNVEREDWKNTIENLIGVSDDFTEKNIIEQICDRCEEVSSD